MTPLVGDLIATVGKNVLGKTVSRVLDRVLPKQMTQGEKIEAISQAQTIAAGIFKDEVSDLGSARDLAMAALQGAPAWIKGYSALVVPSGAYMAFFTFFYNMNCEHWGGKKIAYSYQELGIIAGIFAFYYGYRYKQKKNGLAGKM